MIMISLLHALIWYTERTGIDKDAANRFIKHAIAQAKAAAVERPPGDNEGASGSTQSAPVIKITDKMRAREQYEKELKEANSDGEDDEDVLQTFDEEPIEPSSSTQSKGKHKAVDYMEGGDNDISGGMCFYQIFMTLTLTRK